MKRATTLTLAALALALLGGCSGPPQMGPDTDCFKAVDALYTAVTAKSPKLLDQCEKNLSRLKEAGKLPEPAWASLQGTIATAREGRWRPAAEELTWFMKGQRRGR